MAYPLKEQWTYKAIPNFLGGLDQSKQPDALNDMQCVTLRDIKITDNMLVSRNGFSIYGFTSGLSGGFTQHIQASVQFNRRNGTSELLVITLGSMYKYNSAVDKWLLVAGPLFNTTTSGYAAGATVIAITSNPGFIIGHVFSIVLDNTDIHTAVISNVAGLNITINAGIPVGRSVVSGARVYRPASFSGALDKLVSTVAVPGSDWMVFTNGVDAPQRWNGTSCEPVPGTTSYVCRAVALYNTALFLLSTTEGGTPYPQRARRSNQTDPTDWTGGTAGYDDLLDSSDTIICARLLGPYMIVYKSRSIIRCSFIGSSGLNYQYETTITHEGAITSSAVVTVKDRHVFVGHNNVYEYAGDFTITPIGNQIRPTLFSAGKNVNPTYDYIIFALYIETFDEVWVFYPRLDYANSACNYAFRYHVGTGVWYDSYFNFPVRGGAVYRTENEEGEVNFQLHDFASKKIIAYNANTYTDPFEFAIPFIVETKDYIMADGRFRFDMLELFIQGTSILLQYSTDAGVTYTTMATITQAVQGKVRVHRQFVCDRVRFKLSGTASNFKLSWAGFSYKIENLYASGSGVY